MQKSIKESPVLELKQLYSTFEKWFTVGNYKPKLLVSSALFNELDGITFPEVDILEVPAMDEHHKDIRMAIIASTPEQLEQLLGSKGQSLLDENFVVSAKVKTDDKE